DGELGDAGLAGDQVHAGAVEAVLGEHALGRLEDRRALGEVLRAAWTGLPGRGARLAGGDVGHGLILYHPVLYSGVAGAPVAGCSGSGRPDAGIPPRPGFGARLGVARPARPVRQRDLPAESGCALEPTDIRNP